MDVQAIEQQIEYLPARFDYRFAAPKVAVADNHVGRAHHPFPADRQRVEANKRICLFAEDRQEKPLTVVETLEPFEQMRTGANFRIVRVVHQILVAKPSNDSVVDV